jgi:imidazolonepropionase-like amidohydrolase
MKCFLSGFLFILLAFDLCAQTTFPVNGAPFNPHSSYAFVNANIYSDDETLITKGTLLIKDGKITDVGASVSVPANAIVYDLKGKYVYPSFIDLYSEYGMPEVKAERRHGREPQMESSVKGAYGWNQAVRAGTEAHRVFTHQAEKAEEYRKAGFGAVLTSQADGIVRGSAAFVLLNNRKKENESVIIDRAAAVYSFNKGTSTQDYPSSLAGAIALIRQTYYDAQWYARGGSREEYNISLDEFSRLQSLPAVFDAGDKFNALRAVKIGKEFNVKYIIKGAGNEYQRIGDISATGSTFIIPVNFPLPFDVEDPYEADAIPISELKHWEMAPANAAILEKNNVSFCITAAGHKDMQLFLKNLRKAVRYGLSEKTALKALTRNPAKLLNASDRIGSLRKGYIANFFICSRPFFDEESALLQHWVGGEPDLYFDLNMPDIRGVYRLTAGKKDYEVRFTGDPLKPKGKIKIDTSGKELSFRFVNEVLTFSFAEDTAHLIRAHGYYDAAVKSFSGRSQDLDGSWSTFTMSYVSSADTAQKKNKPAPAPQTGRIIYPFTAYGEPLPEDKGAFKDSWNKFRNRYSAILIRHANVWTNEHDSVLKDHDVYIVEGKIVRIGIGLEAPKLAFAKVIDAKGMHLTPGIIDEHSHIALTGGVNEGTQASSAEVRMGDVINPDDINIYRQLAGGVTTSQLLHGSANPVGGQSAIIKLRWGHSAEDMKYENADPFIKFALGENVKQSNWGDLQVVRFPQSRMGVEQVYADIFTRAREYDAKKGVASRNALLVRKDLELEAIAEILKGKRFITCHSYVQSEINMLMRLADSLKFRVNTFTHILEGYKLADKMKAHGAAASTFSDWWAYKNEVMDAIPYNAALLTRMGVLTSMNSDDAEMARRLNQEAAKAVKYGGLSETEALKLVTLNPAKMLHIDDKVGTIRAGKVADVVLWTGHPLSVYSRVDKTIIDGSVYFDRSEDERLRNEMRAERARLIAKLLLEKGKGEKTVKPSGKQQRLYHCNTIEGVDEELTGHR